MKLLKEEELIWSPIVANNRMNRKRTARGINSYEKEFGFSLEKWLDAYRRQEKNIKWLDLCCGEGNALIQYAAYIEKQGLQDNVKLKGIDLVDEFQPIPSSISCLQFEVKSLVGLTYDESYDLITCVHGLHYVGDKLAVLSAALKALSETGMFIANLDLKSIKIEGMRDPKYLQNKFKDFKVSYNSRRKILSCIGTRNIDFNLQYLGADENAGPNYTGQEAVDAYYLFE